MEILCPHKRKKERKSEPMIREDIILQAKQVDINKVVDYLEVERCPGMQNKIACPLHVDKTPSLVWHKEKNQYHCFSCGKNMDTIDLYRAFTGATFQEAIVEIFKIDGIPSTSIKTKSMNMVSGSHSSNANGDLYDMVLNNCTPITGYEFDYLHRRGIFLYDSYIYEGEVYSKREMDGSILCPANDNDRDFALDVEMNGILYPGIAEVLKANRIYVMHNFWNSINNIIYKIDFSYDDDERLQRESLFLKDMERHLLIKKSEDWDDHTKQCLGTNEFIWIADGIGKQDSYSGDVYICEGIEDALSFVQNGHRAISLNSVNNVHALVRYLEKQYRPKQKQRFILAFDHDQAGEKATQEMIDFFDNYNGSHKHKYDYGICDFPAQFHDINDYWVSKVYGTT